MRRPFTFASLSAGLVVVALLGAASLPAQQAAQQPDTLADSARRAENARRDAAAATAFYAETAPFAVTLTADLGRLRRDRQDGAPWRTATLGYDDPAAPGGHVELAVRARTRGRWRLENCLFPPLRLDLPRGAARETRLAGLNRPKLVAHCRDDDRSEQYVLQEFQLYRIYALVAPVAHRARLLRVTYADSASRRVDAVRWAIVLEEPEALAERHGGWIVDQRGATPADLDTASMTLMAVFQYMIGNTDWSVGGLHNAELVATSGPLHPVPYDFDHAGAVNAHYALPPPQLPLRSVRQRLFRGYCVAPAAFEHAFARFRERRAAITALYADEIGRLMAPRTVERTLEYFDEFWRTLDDPELARRRIVEACRSRNDA